MDAMYNQKNPVLKGKKKRKIKERKVCRTRIFSVLPEPHFKGWLTEMWVPETHIFTCLNEQCDILCNSACPQTWCGEASAWKSVMKQEAAALSAFWHSDQQLLCVQLTSLPYKETQDWQFYKLRRRKSQQSVSRKRTGHCMVQYESSVHYFTALF